MTCEAPWTEAGVAAIDPTGGLVAGDCRAPLVSVEELSEWPTDCTLPDEAVLTDLLVAISDRIEDALGYSLRPCLETRVIQGCGYRVRLPEPILRVDGVKVGPCRTGCGVCPQTWTDVDLCDVTVVGERQAVLAPWVELELCNGVSTCSTGGVLVTGLWGAVWPLPAGVAIAIKSIVQKMARAIVDGSSVIVSNNEDGTTSFTVPDFGFEELGLVPKSLVRHTGCGV